MKREYESDDERFDAPAYTVEGYRGIAWYVLGWEVEPDEETRWSGYRVRTGQVICRMVGDDRDFLFYPDELCPIEREAYCGECGQVGCCHDGLVREG